MNKILVTNNLCKDFEQTKVLKNINLEVLQNEFLIIMGRSGSGKSTLLYSMSGMDHPTSGHVMFDNEDIATLSDDKLSEIRLKKMGFIFQHSHLLKKLSVIDNIVLPGYKANLKSRQDVNEDAKTLMEKTEITDIADKDIKKISGGQLQRAAICRALINQPKILFGDEPTGALNSSTTKDIMDILNSIHQQGTTVVLVTHDTKVALRGSRVVFLIDGQIVDELSLGNYLEDKDLNHRELVLSEWLEGLNF